MIARASNLRRLVPWTFGLFALTLPLAVVGCGAPVTTPDAGGAATFTMVKKVFPGSCALSDSCHNAKGKMGSLDLATDPYTALVNAPTKTSPAYPLLANLVADFPTLVTPGDVSKSAMWKKLNLTVENDPKYGIRMPQGNGNLDAATLALFQSWITDGAKNN